MARCTICGRETLVSGAIGVCAKCLRERPREALLVVRRKRQEYRARLGLPITPPQRSDGVPCGICVNGCRIPIGGRGYCGIWVNRDGRLEPLQGHGRLLAYTYLDPHPTNCTAGYVCPANTSRGYPRYTFTEGVEKGYYNLAVFLLGCPLDCHFCQNPEHKLSLSQGLWHRYIKSIDQLVEEALDPRVTCICYFGGDPTPHMPMLIQVSRRILMEAEKRGQWPKRICWETDGLASPPLMREAARLSLVSGGIVKIDWKAWTPSIYEALTGANGERALRRLRENTEIIASMARERPEPPLLVISVLLVPGYVDAEEVGMIASYVSGLMDRYNIDIPMVLLAFHPDYRMRDLPPTSKRHALEAYHAARKAGVREVFIGNAWLLGDYY